MAVVALEVKTRQALACGQDFGDVGRYAQIDGAAHFAVDPTHLLNRCITDIDLARQGGDGLVHFSADIRILTPEDPRRGFLSSGLRSGGAFDRDRISAGAP